MRELPGLVRGTFRNGYGEFCALGAAGVKSTQEFEALFPGDRDRKSRVRQTASAIMRENDEYWDGYVGRKNHVLNAIQRMKLSAR